MHFSARKFYIWRSEGVNLPLATPLHTGNTPSLDTTHTATCFMAVLCTHNGHKGTHYGHKGTHNGHKGTHSGHKGTHNGHKGTHSGHKGTHSGHKGTHSGHKGTHNGHKGTHNGHKGTHNGHKGTHNGHKGTHNGHRDGRWCSVHTQRAQRHTQRAQRHTQRAQRHTQRAPRRRRFRLAPPTYYKQTALSVYTASVDTQRRSVKQQSELHATILSQEVCREKRLALYKNDQSITQSISRSIHRKSAGRRD